MYSTYAFHNKIIKHSSICIIRTVIEEGAEQVYVCNQTYSCHKTATSIRMVCVGGDKLKIGKINICMNDFKSRKTYWSTIMKFVSHK